MGSKSSQSFERAFMIVVTNVNEPPSALNTTNLTVAENSPSGTIIGGFSTTDPDAGDTHTYEFASGGADNASFQIDGIVLKTKAALDYEDDSVYQIKVSSKDASNLVLSRDLTIKVTNVNEKPTALALTKTTIAENSPSGTQIGTFNTTDPDTGDIHTYEFASGGVDNASFEIDGTVLKTKVALDYEDDSVYQIKVSSKDAGNLLIIQDWTIKVTNVVAEVAKDISLSTNSIRENNARGDSIGLLSVVPADVGGTYSLVGGRRQH